MFSGLHQRKTNYERCAQTFTWALGMDGSTMYFHQVTNDGKSQPKSSVGPGARSIGLTEAVKHSWQKVRLDPFTGITHRDHCMRTGAVRPDLHRAISRCEFHGIRQKVPDYLPQAIDIAV